MALIVGHDPLPDISMASAACVDSSRIQTCARESKGFGNNVTGLTRRRACPVPSPTGISPYSNFKRPCETSSPVRPRSTYLFGGLNHSGFGIRQGDPTQIKSRSMIAQGTNSGGKDQLLPISKEPTRTESSDVFLREMRQNMERAVFTVHQSNA